jgi:hypothetical protein
MLAICCYPFFVGGQFKPIFLDSVGVAFERGDEQQLTVLPSNASDHP